MVAPSPFLPQEPAQPFGGVHEQEVVDLVDVPLVQQEPVQDRLVLGQFARQIGPPDVELEGRQKKPISIAMKGLSRTQVGT